MGAYPDPEGQLQDLARPGLLSLCLYQPLQVGQKEMPVSIWEMNDQVKADI